MSKNYAKTLTAIAEGAAPYCNTLEVNYLQGFIDWLATGKHLTNAQFTTLASIARTAVLRKEQLELAESEFALWIRSDSGREALSLTG